MAQPTTNVQKGSVASNTGTYFPGGDIWESVKSDDLDHAAIEELYGYLKSQNSTGLLVLQNGKILLEEYWKSEELPKLAQAALRRMTHGKTAAGHPIEDVASVQKSVVAVLVGIALQQDLIELDQPVSQYLGVGWSQATKQQENQITIKHLLSMTSGLKDDLTFQATAGSRWKYNTGAYSRLVTVLEKATGKNRDQITRQWLIEPLGMKDSKWVRRAGAARNPVNNQFGFATSCRDLARFGLMVLANGQWDGKTIIKQDEYFKAMFQPSQKLNPLYGYLWWLNVEVEGAAGKAVALLRRRNKIAPADMASARGAMGRRVIVIPSRQLVAIRIGGQPKANFDIQFWQKLSAVIESGK